MSDRIPEAYHAEINFEYKDQPVNISVGDLADGQGIATRMNDDILLDWPNLLMRGDATSARLHMFNGRSGEIPYDEKLRRMEKLAFCIGAFDTIMLPQIAQRFLPGEVMNVIENGRLPRLNEVVLDTGTPGLRKLFTQLDFPVVEELPNPYKPSWQQLAGLAISGELVSVWKSLKSTDK